MSDCDQSEMRADDFPLDIWSLHIDDFSGLQDHNGDVLSFEANCLNGDLPDFLKLTEGCLAENLDGAAAAVAPHQQRHLHQQLVVSSSPPNSAAPAEIFTSQQDQTFQFDLQQLPCARASNNCFPSASPSTPNNTPANTPFTTPDSSNPGSPRGSIYGGTSRRSPTSLKLRKSDGQSSQKVPRHKRESHINAEKRRRNKIQTGFEEIHRLVPTLKEVMQSGSKDSKAAVLSKTVDYCRSLRSENKELDREAAKIRAEIDGLTAQIKVFQDKLPANGISMPQPQARAPLQMDKVFQDYVRARTFSNWKFWMFGLIIQPLFDSFNRMVSTSSLEEFCATTMSWLEQHCSLLALRPVALNSLRALSRRTSIMNTPEHLPNEVLEAAMEPQLASISDESQGGAVSS